MAKPKNITGQKVGSLTAIEISEEETIKRNSVAKVWKCQCDCGNITYVSITNWGKTQSCGCRSNKNLLTIGDKIGHLTIASKGDVLKKIDSATKKGHRSIKTWNCQCECGTFKFNVPEKYLLRGNVKSCGCITRPNKNKSIIENLKHNTYNLKGSYGIGYDSKNKEFYFDLEDYEKIKDYCWNVKYDNYVETSTRKLIEGTSKSLSLHRVVMGIDDRNIYIDHINHKPNDNRKQNLRLVTPSQNQANTKTPISNTSGVKGVHYCSTRHKWIASIKVNKKSYSKSFEIKNDAILYRKYLEDKYQKEYSYKNSVKEEINE